MGDSKVKEDFRKEYWIFFTITVSVDVLEVQCDQESLKSSWKMYIAIKLCVDFKFSLFQVHRDKDKGTRKEDSIFQVHC